MNKKVIIIEGYLASGKSTFALQLSKQINVPYLVKDTFKIALCEKVSITNRDESSIFSAVTFDAMMYVMEREKTFERGQVNKIGVDVPYDVFDKWCRNLDNFDIGGEIVRVDTTDYNTVDFNHYIEFARQFIS